MENVQAILDMIRAENERNLGELTTIIAETTANYTNTTEPTISLARINFPTPTLVFIYAILFNLNNINSLPEFILR